VIKKSAKMIQKLLFPETEGLGVFDATKTELNIGSLVEDYKRKEAFGFEQQNK
jgi:hypothetical protein